MISPFTALLLIAALMTLAVAAIRDMKERIIPDRLVLAVLGIGAVLRLMAVDGPSWMTLVAAIVVFLPMSFLSARNIVGGGDAKMITAITFLFPPGRLALPLVMIALAGGVLSLAYLAAGFVLRAWRMPAAIGPSHEHGPLGIEAARATTRGQIPFAVAIFAGVALSIFFEVLPCISETSSSTSCSL